MGTVLAVANQKGGVGKTTTVVSLAAALVARGQRVLVVDLDAQGCATFSLGLDPEDLQESVASALLDEGSATLLRVADGIDLLPATMELAAADHALARQSGREFVVRELLDEVRDRYDWILLDCSPSLGILTVAALVAADAVLIPLQCETLSHRGVAQLMETIDEVRRLANPSLRVAGLLPTLFDGRTTHARAVLADLESRYGVPVLGTITRSVRFAESPAAGRSILATSPRSRGAQDYRELADALLAQESAGDTV